VRPADAEPASFVVPPGACDTHSHVVAASGEYPMVGERNYTPPPATEQMYLAMLDATGMTYGVLVQITVYGTDNRYLLEVLRHNPTRLRGVAMVAFDISDRELEQMHEAGVRGVRMNVLYGGPVDVAGMSSLARRISELGWHMQFVIGAQSLPELMPHLRRLACPGVIDHMGHLPANLGVNHPGFQTLLRLVKEHGFWVKLSGAYRLSDDWDRFSDVRPFAQALIEAAPSRMVWGSDWPHVGMTRMPNTGQVRNQLADWAAGDELRRQILVDNPGRLYGFSERLPSSHSD